MGNIIVPIIIPCNNEKQNLPILIKELKSIPSYFLPILIDNASTDGSGEFAKEQGLNVLKEPRLGYGFSCLKGINFVFSNFTSTKAPFIAFLDADLSERPKDLIKLVQAIRTYKFDLVIGNRSKGFKLMPIHVQLANKFFALLLRLFFRSNLKDNGPLRIIRYETLQELNLKDKYYGWTFEMTIKALKMHKRVGEIAINYYGRKYGISKISGNLKNSIISLFQILWYFIIYLP